MVDAENLSRALGYKLLLLLKCESSVDSLIIDLDDRLLAHSTGRHWRPLRVHLSNAFLGNHSQVELLVFAEHHESDRVSFLGIILVVDDRLDS